MGVAIEAQAAPVPRVSLSQFHTAAMRGTSRSARGVTCPKDPSGIILAVGAVSIAKIESRAYVVEAKVAR